MTFKNESGFALIFTMLTLVVLSVLGLSIMAVTVSNVSLTKTSNQHDSTYYVAESGVNEAIAKVKMKVNELSEQPLSHDDFFTQLDIYINDHLHDKRQTLDQNFGTTPEAHVSFDEAQLVSEQSGEAYSERTMSYNVGSLGETGQRQRSLSAVLDISHRVTTSSGGGSTGPLDFLMHSASEHNMGLPGGGDYDGDFYSKHIEFNAANTTINGSIISENGMALRSALTVTGDLYALDGNIELTNSDVVVNGTMHANGNVHLSHGTKANDIYASGNVHLTSGNTINGAIHAGGFVRADSGATLTNIFAGTDFRFGSAITVNGDVHTGRDFGVTDSGNNIQVNGRIFAGRNVHTRGWQNYRLFGNVHAANNVFHGEGNQISGNVVAGNQVIRPGSVGNRGTVSGSITEGGSSTPPLNNQAPDFSDITQSMGAIPLTEFSVGSTNVTSSTNGTIHNLTPGQYNNLSVRYSDSVRLSSGNYFFNQINLNQTNVTLYLDFSEGPINLYAKGNIQFGSHYKIYVSENGSSYSLIDKNFVTNNREKAKEYAGQFYVETHQNLTLPNDVVFIGSVLANQNLTTSSNVILVGAYSINNGSVNMGYGPTVIYAPPTTSAGAGHSTGSGGSPGGGSGGSIISSGAGVSIKAPVTED